MNPRDYYPTEQQVDKWAEGVYRLGIDGALGAEIMPWDETYRHPGNFHQPQMAFIRFSTAYSADFYALWQPTLKSPAPLVVHVPGYGAEMSMHPALVDRGYHVLHICPLGYVTPNGRDETKLDANGDWPVLPDTIRTGGREGYRFWLANCVQAIRWAQARPEVLSDRLSFMGTSQGGGGAMLLASVYQNRHVRCVGADVPFLTNHPMAEGQGAYRHTKAGLDLVGDKKLAWHAVGLVDTTSHLHRLRGVPILLTAGGKDTVCPAKTIRALREGITWDCAFYFMENMTHRYTPPFLKLFEAWLEIYA